MVYIQTVFKAILGDLGVRHYQVAMTKLTKMRPRANLTPGSRVRQWPMYGVAIWTLPAAQWLGAYGSPQYGEILAYYLTLLTVAAASLMAVWTLRVGRYSRGALICLELALAFWALGLLAGTVQISFVESSANTSHTLYCYLLYTIWVLLLFYIVSTYGDSRVSFSQKLVDAVLMFLLAFMYYVGSDNLLDLHGELSASRDRSMSFADDMLNGFLCLAYAARMITAVSAQEKRFFKVVFNFLLIYAVCEALRNSIHSSDHAAQTMQIVGQSLATIPFTSLMCMLHANRAPLSALPDPSPFLRRISSSIGPAVLLAAIFALSVGMTERHGVLSIWVVAIAIAVYIVRTIQIQYGYVKTKDELAEAIDALERVSLTDATTHIPNRRAFDRTFEDLSASVVRDDKDLGVLMIDIDYFKRYNDHYGHQAGDECLRTVARLLAGALHAQSAFLARYGGEEFVVLLPGMSEEGVGLVAQDLNQAVAEAQLPHAEGVAGRVTVSIGVAYRRPCEICRDLWLRRADEALYVAKQVGRNGFAWQAE